MEIIGAVLQLMRENYESVGFLPETAIKKCMEQNRLLYLLVGGEVVAYLCHGPIKIGKPSYIWQLVVKKEHRRNKYGEILFFSYQSICTSRMVSRIYLRCADGLDSNTFWVKMGFSIVKEYCANNQRNRKIFRYAKPIIELI